MFPSNNSNSIFNNDQLLRSYINDHSPLLRPSSINGILHNSKQVESDPSFPSFFHFPSPCIQFELGSENDNLFLQNNHNHNALIDDNHQQAVPLNEASETVTLMDDSHKENCSGEQQARKKRQSKKDRHSKINTAKGPRDRRMRLSLEVARDFFGLQDMLGYEKASKTVEWLLIQAQPEIKKLARSLPQANYSVCSVGSKSPSSSINYTADLCEVLSGSMEDKASNASKHKGKTVKEKNVRQARKATLRTLPRDLRAKARERAKERTQEKIRQRGFDESKLYEYEEIMNNEMNQLGSSNWSSFDTGEESGNQSHSNMNNLALQEAEELTTKNHLGAVHHHQGIIIDESLAMINKWRASSILNYHHNNANNILEYQYTDFQFLAKP